MFRKREEYRAATVAQERQVPPRLYEPEGGSRVAPLRSPSQIYPQHEEHAQPDEELWESASRGPIPIESAVDEDIPEAVLAEGICVTGQLKFQRYLRIDGEFEGEIVSDGKIVVGPRGVVRSNLSLREAIIEGRVEGNITAVERIELRGEAQIEGNLETALLSVDEGVAIHGTVKVVPAAPTT